MKQLYMIWKGHRQNSSKSTPEHCKPCPTSHHWMDINWISSGHNENMFPPANTVPPKWQRISTCSNIFAEFVDDFGWAHIQSPIANTFAAAKRYHIDDAINAFMRNDNAIGMYVEAKMMVKRVVWKNEYERWKASCLSYKELSFYMVAVNRINIHAWWKLAKIKPQLSNHIGSVITVLCGGQPRGSQRNMKQSICQICDLREDDDSSRVLFVCPALNNERDNSWVGVKNVMPPAMVSGIDALPVPEKVKLLLTCWNSNFLPECTGLYVDTVHFVTSMYRCRAGKYDLMDNVTWSCVQRLGR